MKCCLVPLTSCDRCKGKIWSCYFQKFMRRCFYKKIHYWTFDLELGVKVTQNITQYPQHHVTYAQAKFEVATFKSLWEDAFTRKYIIWPLTLTLGLRSHIMSPSTLYIMWSMHLQSLKLLRPTVKEEIQLQEMWHTDRQTDGQTQGRTTDRLCYEINIPYFSNEKSGITMFHLSQLQSSLLLLSSIFFISYCNAYYFIILYSNFERNYFVC